MSSLPTTPFMLRGGCFCRAITYEISVPPLTARPLTRYPPERPLGPQNAVTDRLPIIALDHCNSCRRISGSIVECWFICPQSWSAFSLLPRSSATNLTDEQDVPQARLTPHSMVEYLRPSKELEEMTYVKGFQSSEFVHKTFCGRCGTHLTVFSADEGDEMAREGNWGPHFDVPVGTLENECVEMTGVRPGRQGWWGDGIGWVREMIAVGERAFDAERED